MPSKALKTLEVRTREEWRAWLARHHASESELWLVFHKRHTGRASIAYEDAVEEALCFGWIDSLIRRLDDRRYARKFTPRRSDSKWSAVNRKRYAALEASGRLMPAGARRSPAGKSRHAPRPSLSRIPRYILEALARRPAARRYFESLAPSYRRNYLAWIDSAKKDETKTRRLRKALSLLEAGRKLGLE
jgi:uncharacterized protein YdeI (YjbR/CyaY-like superfamily)